MEKPIQLFDFSLSNLEKGETSRYLGRLSKKAFKDRQLLIGNLLTLAKDAYDCNSEYFTAICTRIENECKQRGYTLKE